MCAYHCHLVHVWSDSARPEFDHGREVLSVHDGPLQHCLQPHHLDSSQALFELLASNIPCGSNRPACQNSPSVCSMHEETMNGAEQCPWRKYLFTVLCSEEITPPNWCARLRSSISMTWKKRHSNNDQCVVKSQSLRNVKGGQVPKRQSAQCHRLVRTKPSNSEKIQTPGKESCGPCKVAMLALKSQPLV